MLGNYKRKQESKKTKKKISTKKAINKKRKKEERKHALHQESDQEKKKNCLSFFRIFMFSFINSHLRMRKNVKKNVNITNFETLET